MEQPRVVPRSLRLTAGSLEIVVDPVCIEDAPALYAAVARNRARLGEWLPWATPDYSIEHTRRFLEDSARENARGSALTCVIRCEGDLAGAIGLHAIDRVNRASSIGYWVDLGFSGRGIITGACRAVVTAGFRDYGLHRIEIRCATGNERSCAIPRRLGFREEGVLREAGRVRDRWVDLRVFSILEHEWAWRDGGAPTMLAGPAARAANPEQ